MGRKYVGDRRVGRDRRDLGYGDDEWGFGSSSGWTCQGGREPEVSLLDARTRHIAVVRL